MTQLWTTQEKEQPSSDRTSDSNFIQNTSNEQDFNAQDHFFAAEVDNQRFAKKDRVLGSLTLIGGVFLMMYLSCIYLWGNISIYVLSYFYQFDQSLSLGLIFFLDMFLVGFECVGYNLGAYLLNSVRLHPKKIIAIGASLSLTGVFLSSFSTSVWAFLAFYCVINGAGLGINFMVSLVCAWEYFPDHKGLVTGIMTGSQGFGSFLFSILSTRLVNPDQLNANVKTENAAFFESDVAERVPQMMRTLVAIWAVLVLISILLINRRPQERVLQAETESRQLESQVTEDTSRDSLLLGDQEEQQWPEIASAQQCWDSIRFWQYCALLLLGNVFPCIFMYSFKVYGELNGISDLSLSWCASIGSGVINGLSALVMGYLSDKVDFQYLFGSIFTISTVLGLTISGAVQSPYLYYSYVLMNYFCQSSFFAILPAAVNKTFGIRFAPKIYAIILSAGFLCTIINYVVVSQLLPLAGYLYVFLCGAICSFCSFLILLKFDVKLDVENLPESEKVSQFETADHNSLKRISDFTIKSEIVKNQPQIEPQFMAHDQQTLRQYANQINFVQFARMM